MADERRGDLEKQEETFNEQTRAEYGEVFNREARELTDAELKTRVKRFLGHQVIGTLATCSNNEPRSTPVRYVSDGLDVYILTEGGGKIHNIRENPRVAFSVYGKYRGFQTVRGLQIWGHGEIIEPEDTEKYDRAFGRMNLKEREDLKKLDAPDIAPGMTIIWIVPERLRFLSIPEGILNRELTP